MTDTPTAHAGARQDSTPEQAAPDLLPCPFCGASAYTYDDCNHSTAAYVTCGDDDCLGSDLWFETVTEAIAAWNRRAAPSAQTRERCGNCGAFGQKCYGNGPEGPDCEDWIGESNGQPCCYACYGPAPAPAEVEWLEYAAIDAIRLEAFRTNDPDTKQRFLNAAGRWFQYETCREMDRASALTALQAENERLTTAHDTVCGALATAISRAEKAEAVADQLVNALLKWKAGHEHEDVAALSAYAKLKGDV